MSLAHADIWIEKEGHAFYVKLRNGQTCNVIGPMNELEANKVHAHLVEAVFNICVEQAALLKEQRVHHAV